MIDNKSQLVHALADAVGGRVVGNGELAIHSFADVERAVEGEIAFVQDAKQVAAAQASAASCVIIPEGIELEAGKTSIIVRNPKLAFARIAKILRPHTSPHAFVHPTAIVHANAQLDASVALAAHTCVGARTRIGAGTEIKAGAIIGADVSIGDDCVLHPHVVVYDNVTIGSRVTLHAGVTIGADGFGYVRDDAAGTYIKFPQTGTVTIEDDVEIGAGSCVDRAALAGETRIGRGTKIDNLVQIAHNVRIGERVVIASQTGISGSTIIEDDCIIGGQVGFGDHARVERGAIIGSKAGVLPGKIVRGNGAVYWGVPVRPLAEYKIMNAHMGRLPQMRRELDRLREQVDALETPRTQEDVD